MYFICYLIGGKRVRTYFFIENLFRLASRTARPPPCSSLRTTSSSCTASRGDRRHRRVAEGGGKGQSSKGGGGAGEGLVWYSGGGGVQADFDRWGGRKKKNLGIKCEGKSGKGGQSWLNGPHLLVHRKMAF